jgi:hypothetical protein
VRLEGLGQLKNPPHQDSNRDLPASSIVPQPTYRTDLIWSCMTKHLENTVSGNSIDTSKPKRMLKNLKWYLFEI